MVSIRLRPCHPAGFGLAMPPKLVGISSGEAATNDRAPSAATPRLASASSCSRSSTSAGRSSRSAVCRSACASGLPGRLNAAGMWRSLLQFQYGSASVGSPDSARSFHSVTARKARCQGRNHQQPCTWAGSEFDTTEHTCVWARTCTRQPLGSSGSVFERRCISPTAASRRARRSGAAARRVMSSRTARCAAGGAGAQRRGEPGSDGPACRDQAGQNAAPREDAIRSQRCAPVSARHSTATADAGPPVTSVGSGRPCPPPRDRR